jgi:CheY-like chemotaxis protein
MRPKKRILLAGSDEDRVGVLRYMLETNGFAVTTALTAADAIARMHDAPQPFELLVCEWPMQEMPRMLDAAHAPERHTPSLVIARSVVEPPEGIIADGILTRPNWCSTELLAKAKMLSARKRGPRKGSMKKPVVGVSIVAGVSLVEGELVRFA